MTHNATTRCYDGFKALVRCLAFLAAMTVAVASPPIGPDIENYNPPFSQSREIIRWQEVYQAGDFSQAEYLVHAILDQRKIRDDRAFRRIEAIFALGITLEQLNRQSEAETQFRDGLARLRPLQGSETDKLKITERERLARDWAFYFEVHLRQVLRQQGRIREANLLQSIIPRFFEENLFESGGRTEVAVVGSIPGIASDLETGNSGTTELTSEQKAAREALKSAARKAQASGSLEARRKLLRDLLAFDEPLYGIISPQVAYDARELAEAEFDLGRFDESATLARRAIGIFEQTDRYRHELIGSLRSLSDAVEATGDRITAETLLRRAVSVAGQSKMPYLELDLAANIFAQGRLLDAETLYRDVLKDGRLDRTTDSQVRIFLGYIGLQQGDFAKGVGEYRKICTDLAEWSIQMTRGSRATLGPSNIRNEAADCSIRHAIGLSLWNKGGAGTLPSDRPEALLSEAFLAAQRAQPDPSAQALAHAGARAAAMRSGVGPLVERYDTAVRERDATGGAPPEDWLNAGYVQRSEADEAKLETYNQTIAELSGKIANEAPRFWELRSPQPVGIAALQARNGPDAALLKDDEALIYFMVPPDQRHGLVFAISKDKIAWARLEIDHGGLRDKINALRSAIDSGAYGVTKSVNQQGVGEQPFDRKLAHELYGLLFGDPAIQDVIAPKPTWIIVPAGPLTTLPPGLLVTNLPEGGQAGDDDDDALRSTHWLIRSKAVAILPSVASLRTIRQILPVERVSAQNPLLAFVDPDYSAIIPAETKQVPVTGSFASYYRGGVLDMAALHSLSRLPLAREEGDGLMKVLKAPAQAVLWGRAASKARLMEVNASGGLAQVRVIDFATHGFAAGADDGVSEPLIVLAAADRPENWVLKASEAAGLQLNADWVILSGCNTASPDVGAADGLSGLARAFFFAGASSLLVSHWRIDDEIASRLVPMTVGLHNAHKNVSKAQALRLSMLAILNDHSLTAAHPAYWAPFVLIGDPG